MEKRFQLLIWLLLTLILSSKGQTPLVPFPSGEFITSENCLNGNPGIRIISNGTLTTASPGGVEISIDGEMTYVARDMIHLKPGFHAGNFDAGAPSGYFRTEFLSDNNFILVSPGASSIVNGVVHVPQWEKLEIGFKLPPVYETAIDTFFNHYYDPAPGNQVNPLTDLNPYASDSLNVRIILTSPSGRILTRYGFFMREATWGPVPNNSSGTPTPGAAELTEDFSALSEYNWRFRFAPDEVDLSIPWTMRIQVIGPYFTGMPEIDFGYFSFFCDPPLPDNHGYLHVNQDNKHYLKFDDGTDYFGIGMNLTDQRKGYRYPPNDAYLWYKGQREDYELLLATIEEMAQNGGNEIRLAFHRGMFVPEHENLGVYDAYSTPEICASGTGSWLTNLTGNRQMDCWMIDRIIEKCREENVYIQLCLMLMNIGHAFEQYGWGDNAYYRNYVFGNPAPGSFGGYDTKRFYISTGLNNPNWKTQGSMYYWKRYLRYFFSRWGYSTNIAWIETINEIDLTMHYKDADCTTIEHLCVDNRINFQKEQASIDYIKEWHRELISFSKTNLDYNGLPNNDGFNHMWSVSYADTRELWDDRTDAQAQAYYDLFSLDEIDVMDLHFYDYWYYPDGTNYSAANKNINYQRFLRGNRLFSLFNKPFCYGEASTWGRPIRVQDPGFGTSLKLDKVIFIYQNYKIPYHNQIWASALSGACSVAKTWEWQIVAWWENGMPKPLEEGIFTKTNLKGQSNTIYPNGSTPLSLVNEPILNQFQSLHNFVESASLSSLVDFKYIYDENNNFESALGFRQSNGLNKGDAVGWAHHMEKWLDNSYYILQTPTPEHYDLDGNGTNETHLLMDENYMKCQSQSSTVNSGRPIPQVVYTSSPGMDEYHTWPGTSPALPEVSITSNSSIPESYVNFSFPYLACDYVHESIAFIANGASARMGKKNNGNSSSFSARLKIMPNPIGAQPLEYELIVENSNEVTGVILVLDFLGRTVQSIKWEGASNGTIYLNTISEGIYTIVLKTQSWITSERFVKL